jgi:hypothetical protein
MPRTNAQQERSLQDPAVCELLKVRDFLDNVMVRTDGCTLPAIVSRAPAHTSRMITDEMKRRQFSCFRQ